MKAAVFLDRDGVLIEDVDLLVRPEEVRVMAGAAEALCALTRAGYQLIVVSNQTVVARGLSTEQEVEAVNRYVADRLEQAGGPRLKFFYFCPHHPKATLPDYRIACSCRKPRPGMLVTAAADHGIDLSSSFMIGDRITDMVAGKSANCRTVLVQTGRHWCAPIETLEPLDASEAPDFVCFDLASAAKWILSSR